MKTVRTIPFFKPSIGLEEEQAILEVLRSGWLTTGPKVSQFETAFTQFTGARHAIALSSCTAALHLALVSLELKPTDEVITTPFTFSATASEILHAGGKIRFVDVKPEDANIDETQLQDALNENTRAIVPVHFAGNPCNMTAIMEFALENNLSVIEDAAHALESQYKGQKIGAIGDYTCFSFYATKNITTGEGGMLTCDNDIMAEKIRITSLHGMSKDAWMRYLPPGQSSQPKSDYYKILYRGYKYNMSDMQAALGLVQLEKVKELWKLRNKLTGYYKKLLSNVPEIELFSESTNILHARHLMVIKLNLDLLKITRDEVIQKLRQQGIGTSVHFISLHLHPYYRERFGFVKNDFPVAADLSQRVLTLPLFPSMSMEDVDYVVRHIKTIIHENKTTSLISVT